MATDTVVMPLKTYQAGTANLGPATIPLGVTYFRLALSRAFWTDPAVTISAQIWISWDGGDTWQFFGGWTDNGGDHYGDGGVLMTESYLAVAPIPEPENTQRRIKAMVTIAGGPLRTQGVLTLG